MDKRTLKQLEKAVRPDSWLNLSKTEEANLVARGLWDQDYWMPTELGRKYL